MLGGCRNDIIRSALYMYMYVAMVLHVFHYSVTMPVF